LQNLARPGATALVEMTVREIYNKCAEQEKLCKVGLGQGFQIERIGYLGRMLSQVVFTPVF
jgi:hypothetical protein